MKPVINLLFYVFLFQGCNTLYNSRLVNLEIVEPGNVMFPANYKNVAVKYNNSNVSQNQRVSDFLVDSILTSDTSNLDSVAAEVYYQAFINNLMRDSLLDSIIVIPGENY